MPNFPVKVLWCGNSRFQRKNGWSFPPAVKKLLKKETQDRQVLQLFGGLADWGTRLDIDETTNPDYLGDAWLPRTKPAPVTYFQRGPAMKYNRWLAQPNSLFSEMLPAPIANAKKIGRRGILAGVV